ncbi:outer membrane protein assembly factor BamA [Desulfurivibrio dismutans]|uniref:outer membrane protein assembly factor BamA n=1 Tax=Desulfurivibrio dismutans TaxID=1398908 RepID=UPI0023DCAED0|nr:outer membrane protein assembly factor BamA [Desulfurivibrio alkaliphilus]MDF1613607.1 outer membrane protein assembly factor BamA [Desulfurivibrio alkaliphilus]
MGTTAPSELQRQTDQMLAELAGEQGFLLLAREQLPAELAAPGAWPPAIDELAALSLPPGVRYLVAGSLSAFGQQISVDAQVFDLESQDPPRHFTGPSSYRDQLAAALTELGGQIMAFTEPASRISAIHIEGNRNTGSGAILRRVSSRAGEPLNQEQLREDLRAIFAMGFFDDVRIVAEETATGTRLTFVVQEKPVIDQVIINGNDRLRDREIRENITVVPNTIVNTSLIQEAAESIRQLYKEKGYHNSQVSPEIDEVDDNRVDVRFEIEEGDRVYIRRVNFTGNDSFRPRPLRKVMNTKKRGLFSWLTGSGRLQPDMLEQDRARIAAFYHNQGFIDARVGEPEVEQVGKRFIINFHIEEGERYRVGEVKLSGEFITAQEELQQLLQLPRQEYFSRDVLRADLTRLSDRYAEEGYAFADVEPIVSRDDDRRQMDITINLQKNTLVHINRIVIRGNTRTRDNVIRREMQVREGDIMDTGAIRRSMERLQRLDFFEEVNIQPEPALMRDDLMDIEIEVKEKPTGTFSIGAGYSSMDQLMFMGQISQENFRGKGQRLALQADISSKATHYNLSFTDPRLYDTRLLFGIDLYNWRREYIDYTKESTGGAVRFGYPIWEHWRAYWGYGHESNKLTDVRDTASSWIIDSMDLKRNRYVRLGFNRDTRDNRLDPTRGSFHDIGLKHAGGWLGGDTAFTRVEASSTKFFPWEGIPLLRESRNNWLNDTTFRLKGAAGYIKENETDRLPIYEKFFLGGLRTMRGFETATISPRDPDPDNDDRIGGEMMWYMNSEWIFPIVRDINLKGLIFYDVGNVYTKYQGWDVHDLKSSVGFGFRWLSPLGPLRLEWGYNLDPEPDERRNVWDFSIGGVF